MDFSLSAAQEALLARVRRLSAESLAPRAAEYDRDATFPADNFADLSQAGLLGLLIPPAYGGLGLDFLSHVLVLEELAKGCGSTALCLTQHLGATFRVGMANQEEIKQRYFKQVIAQGKIFGIAFSELTQGGKLLEHEPVIGRRVPGGYLVSGIKSFATNAGGADYFLINARTGEDGPPEETTNIFIVQAKDNPGVTIKPTWDAMGLRATCSHTLMFKDCFVAEEDRLNGHGGGYPILKRGKYPFALGFSATSLGVASAAFTHAVEHVGARRIAGGKERLADQQGIRFMVAEMQIGLSTARTMLHRAGWYASHRLSEIPTVMQEAKYVCNTQAIQVTNTAMQVCGGRAYLKSLPLERYLRDARAGSLLGPTTELCREGIARTLLKLDE